MLRRKLIVILGFVTVMLVMTAALALWALQGLFVELNHVSKQSAVINDQSSELGTAISQVQVELYALQAGQTRHLDATIHAVKATRSIVDRIGKHYVLGEAAIQPIYQRLARRMDEFQKLVGALATTQDPTIATNYNIKALKLAAEMRTDSLLIARYTHDHVHKEQLAMTQRFRWLIIGIALGALLVINLSVMMMLRAAGMILRPVNRLIAASRELGQGHFEHRVEVGEANEFDELGQAYNHLAEQLQQIEQRRIEVLGHVALTLNHELNNAMAVIELQLQLLQRRSPECEASRKALEQIGRSLRRMAQVVESLKHVRRIVLTDYTQGLKMLDLEKSIHADEEPDAPIPAAETVDGAEL